MTVIQFNFCFSSSGDMVVTRVGRGGSRQDQQAVIMETQEANTIVLKQEIEDPQQVSWKHNRVT